MSKLSLGFEVSPVACTGTEGSHQDYLRYYFASVRPDNLSSQEFMIEHTPENPESILALADDHLEHNHPLIPRDNVHVAAACVLRLCMDHENPRVEVRDRVIAVPPEHSTYSVNITDKYKLDETLSEGLGKVANIKWPYPGLKKGLPLRAKIFYLPRTEYSGALKAHKAVLSDRGGNAKAVLFGLLGGELLVETPVLPYTSSYSAPVKEPSSSGW